MKCSEECPGDDTCEQAKFCMCGAYMEGHDPMSLGHEAVSMHHWHSYRLPDAETLIELFPEFKA